MNIITQTDNFSFKLGLHTSIGNIRMDDQECKYYSQCNHDDGIYRKLISAWCGILKISGIKESI